MKAIFLGMIVSLCYIDITFGSERAVDFKGQFSMDAISSSINNKFNTKGALRYLPELSYSKSFLNAWTLDLDISANIYGFLSDQNNTESSRVELYRLKSQFKNSNSDLRIGLQKLNFGPALILRSLQWFDQVNLTDPLGLTDGVWATRYRYFFQNSANLWLWGLYGNEDLKGIEQGQTADQTVEYGGRYQFPVLDGEIAFTYHRRKAEKMGFSGIDLGMELNEERYALDGRFDVELGIWFELVAVDQGTNKSNNWYNSLVLGSDYTIAIGNGLHTVVEHQYNGFSGSALNISKPTNNSALQLNYPHGLLDTFSFLQNYSWESEISLSYLSWSRTFDTYSYTLGAFYSETKNNYINIDTSSMQGRGIQMVFMYNH